MNYRRRILRDGLRAALVLAIALVATRLCVLAAADWRAWSDPVAALALRPSHAQALSRAAGQAMQSQRAGAATQYARAAVAAAPLDGRSYWLLANALAMAGTEAPALAALRRTALLRSPREAEYRVWALNLAIGAEDFPAAMRHMDQLLRVHPELVFHVIPVMQALATHPRAQAAFLDALQARPPWRIDLLPRMLRSAPDLSAMHALAEKIGRSPIPLSSIERIAWQDRLIEARQYLAAYSDWIAALSEKQQQRVGNVYNGDFELKASGSAFDWRLGSVPGAVVEQVRADAGSLALRVAFLDRRVPFEHVRQLLVLGPGRHRLQGRVRLDGLANMRGLVWSLACAADSRVFADTEALAGTSGWRQFSLQFEVPASCGAQWLSLRIPARIPAEQHIAGSAWFDDLEIIALPPQAAAPVLPSELTTKAVSH